MRRPLLLALLALLAARPSPALELGLEEAVQRALGHNPRLKAAATEVQITAEQVGIARKDFLPVLKAQGSYTLLDRPPRVVIGSGLFGPGVPPEEAEVTESRELYGLTLTLTQPLFTGGRLRHSLRKQRRLAEQADFDLTHAERLMAAEVKRAYFDVLNGRLASQTQLYRIATAEEALRVRLELRAEGYVGEEEVLALEAEVAQMRAEACRLQSREASADDRFKQLLDLDPLLDVVLSEPAAYAVADIPLEAVRESALRHRADLASRSARVEETDEDVAIARSALLPQLSLQGAYTVQKETSISRDEVWQAGAQLEWQAFDWGRSAAEVRVARSRKRQEVHRREDFRREVLVEAGDAWRRAKEREEDVAARQKHAQAAELALEWALAKEAEGKLQRATVMERALDLLAARNAYRGAIHDLCAAQAELESAASLSLEAWLSSREIYVPKIDPLGIGPRPSTIAVPRTTRFVIQVGSFVERSNAEALKKTLTARLPHATAEIQPRSRGMYRVWLTGFDSAADARSALKGLPLEGYVREVRHAD